LVTPHNGRINATSRKSKKRQDELDTTTNESPESRNGKMDRREAKGDAVYNLICAKAQLPAVKPSTFAMLLGKERLSESPRKLQR
jgi:hypothetical protein